jgi:hypothetical protein
MKHIITPANFTFVPETKLEKKILEYFVSSLCEVEQPAPPQCVGVGLPAWCPNCSSYDIVDGKCSICQWEQK